VEKLRPDGVIAFHVSSRQLELRPLLANAIAAAGLAGSVQRHEPAPGSEHAYGSTWVVAARDGDALAERAPGPDWQAARPDRSTGVWTDDFSNILDVVPWRFADVARGE